MTDSVKWGPGRRDRFIQWARYEVERVRNQRQNLEKKWRIYQELYRTPEPTGIRMFPFEGALLARDTEILTIGGWKRIDALRIGEPVLTRRDGDAKLEWQPVEGFPQRFCEKLYHFKSRSIDLLVSDDHAMLCEPQNDRGRIVRMRADQLWGKTGYYLPTLGAWEGESYEQLFGVAAGDVCEFVGWYLAEGWISKGYEKKPTGICIGQSPTANPEHCERLRTLFTRLGWTWSELTSNGGFYVGKRQIPTQLFAMLVAEQGASRKRVPAFFFTLSPPLIDRLLTGLVLGDGNIHDTYPHGTQPKVNYYTTSRGLADDVQVLTLLAGLQARVRSRVRVAAGGVVEEGRKITGSARSYEVTLSTTPRAKYDRAFREIVEYNDVAFCVTVKNHAIYARRNGTACWTGNSNRIYPLAKMTVDPILARYLRTLHAPPNLWTLQALNERWIPVAKPLQDYMQWLDQMMLTMWDVNYQVIDEMLQLGTGIYKTGWRFERHDTTGYDKQLNRSQVIRMINQPTVDRVPLAHFLVPPEAMDVDPDKTGGAQWVGEIQRFRPEALFAMSKAQEPFLPNFLESAVAEVMKYEESAPTEHQQKVAELDDLPPTTSTMWKRPIELIEMHCRFDADGNGFEEDLVVVYHQPSFTILRATYNPWAHGKRPYQVVRYRRGAGFYGIGVCEQSKMWQDTISDVLNFNIDKILLTNAPMIAIKEGANILPNEQIFPGKIWPLQDAKDMQPFFLAAPGSFDINAMLGFLQEGAKQSTGITDLQWGTVGAVPSRTPAATVSSLLQEGNTRFDMAIQDARLSGLNHVGLQVLQLLQQQAGNRMNNPGGAGYIALAAMILGQPEGGYVAQALQLPFESIETGIGVEITATSGTANRELAKQNELALLQLYAQLGPGFIQLAQIAQTMPGTPAAATAISLFQGGAEFLARVLEQFDVRNAEDLIPNAQALVAAQTAQAQGQPISPYVNGGGMGQPQASGQPAGVGGF